MSKPTAFPLDESRLPFEIPRDEPYREKIARLGQMITDRIPAKKGILTKDAPEHWGVLRDRRDGGRCLKNEGPQAHDPA